MYQSVGVSSLMGFGVDEFFKLVDESRQEYIRYYNIIHLTARLVIRYYISQPA